MKWERILSEWENAKVVSNKSWRMPRAAQTQRKGIAGEGGAQKKQEAPRVGAISTQNGRKAEIEERDPFKCTRSA